MNIIIIFQKIEICISAHGWHFCRSYEDTICNLGNLLGKKKVLPTTTRTWQHVSVLPRFIALSCSICSIPLGFHINTTFTVKQPFHLQLTMFVQYARYNEFVTNKDKVKKKLHNYTQLCLNEEWIADICFKQRCLKQRL